MDIVLDNISAGYPGKPVFKGLSLSFAEGKTTFVMGPSGCGKTTLLKILAGLAVPESGSVSGTSGRRMAYAFQEPRLLPWKTVLENVEFALPSDMPREQRRARALECLSDVELADAASLMPSQLSGGMAQRVSLARALAPQADIILLDEPFSAIDLSLKENIMERLRTIFRESRATVVAVSHSEEEAALFGDRTIRLE